MKHGRVRKTLLYSGYHILQVWAAAVDKELVCEREMDNSYDLYAVAVKRMGNIIGHLPRKLSKLCSLFLRRGGAMVCLVSRGGRK